MIPDFDLAKWTRLAQVFLALISLGLNASVVHFFNTHQSETHAPGYLIFLLFSATFSLLITIPYTQFAPRHFPEYCNRYSSLCIELLTMIFWFSGFVAGAVWLGKIDVCKGSVCNNAKAGVVFAALMFGTSCITSFFPISYCFFDSEDRDLGQGNHALGLGGADKLAQIRSYRHKQNTDPTQSAFNDDEDDGVIDRIRSKAGIAKVRLGNAMEMWRSRSSQHSDSQPGPIVTRQLSKRSEHSHGNMV